MALSFLGTATALLLVTSLGAFAARGSPRAALILGTAGALVAGGVGGAASLMALLERADITVRAPWAMPLGSFQVGVDALSAFFLLLVFLTGGIGALFAAGYLPGITTGPRPAVAVSLYNLLVLSLVGVLVARDAVSFLFAWEILSFTAYFLVTFDYGDPAVRRAGLVYLAASHVGLVPLFLLFGHLAKAAGGSFDFTAFVAAGPPPAATATLLFLLALAGFGLKAGLWPLHLWLPEAHPAAPGHVSALMSAVLIKMGIYGLLRALTFLGPPPAGWAWALVTLGAVSGFWGALHGLAHADVKRILAYSTVENAGLVVLGIGLGLLGQSHGEEVLAAAGYAGALVHAFNHALAKSLLFHSASLLSHATGTRDTDALGGLLRRLPVTAAGFLTGALTIVGLPPSPGFVGEWLLVTAALAGGARLAGPAGAGALAAAAALALIAGLALAGSVRAFGGVFLGLPRSRQALASHEEGPVVKASLVAGMVSCLAFGVWPPGLLALVDPAVASLAGAAPGLAHLRQPLLAVTGLSATLLALSGALALLRGALGAGRRPRTGATWACGYHPVTARMQYTASSFSDPLLQPFALALHGRGRLEGMSGYFPESGHYRVGPGDPVGERVILPGIRRFTQTLARLRVIQHGRIQLYLGYILVTLVVLLVWQLTEGVR